MCRTHQHILNSGLWNWDGNKIEPDTIIKKCRKITGSNILYNVDIREFLTSTDNRIINNTLKGIYEKLPQSHKNEFISRKPGTFDFRVDVIKEYISKNIAYQELSRESDFWLLPGEILSLKKGDCEDRAFLLASLMLASGISKYCVRVVFGKISDMTDRNNYDHVWVMYKNEEGVWQLIEPMSYRPLSKRSESLQAEEVDAGRSYFYRPYYVMNCDHLWSVSSPYKDRKFPEYIQNRTFWKGFTPKFGYKVHKEIVASAIDAEDFKSFLKKWEMQDQLLTIQSFDETLPSLCLNQFAYQVSNVDISLNYDPRIHFDNAFIKESFALMTDNINAKTLRGLAKAFHAIGDIYAHTSFSAFANLQNESGEMKLFEFDDLNSPEYQLQFNDLPYYDTGLFSLNNFSTNENLYKFKDSKVKAIEYWKDNIISGRFGQAHDSQGLLEHTQYWPGRLKENVMQGALPHHNEIAVDGPVFDPKKHKLYKNEVEYKGSYEIRKKMAVKHISKKYDEWKSLF